MLAFGLRRSNRLEFELELKKRRQQTGRDKNQQIVYTVFVLIFEIPHFVLSLLLALML